MGVIKYFRDLKDLGSLALELRRIWRDKPTITEKMLGDTWDAVVDYLIGRKFLKPDFDIGQTVISEQVFRDSWGALTRFLVFKGLLIPKPGEGEVDES